jgi:hypothetical protein
MRAIRRACTTPARTLCREALVAELLVPIGRNTGPSPTPESSSQSCSERTWPEQFLIGLASAHGGLEAFGQEHQIVAMQRDELARASDRGGADRAGSVGASVAAAGQI